MHSTTQKHQNRTEEETTQILHLPGMKLIKIKSIVSISAKLESIKP